METEEVESLKKQASEINISFSELIRQKIKPNHSLIKIEFLLEKILQKIENER